MNYTGDRGNIPDQQQQYGQQDFCAPNYNTKPRQQSTQTPPAGEKGFGASVFRAAGVGTLDNDCPNLNYPLPQQPLPQCESAAYYNAQPQPVQAATAEKGRGSSEFGHLSAAGGRFLGNRRDKPSLSQQQPMQYGQSAMNADAQPFQPSQLAPGAEREKRFGSSAPGAAGGGLLGSRLGPGMVGTVGGALAGAAGMGVAHKLYVVVVTV